MSRDAPDTRRRDELRSPEFPGRRKREQCRLRRSRSGRWEKKMRRERALHLYIQLMGCGGTVNRLLVDKIEGGVAQNFGHGALPIKQEHECELEQETRRSRLARDVALGEEPEAFTDQNRGGAFGIVDVHGERAATGR